MQNALSLPSITPGIDIIAFSFFSAFKQEAFDEVSVITDDFNPLPSREPDQQALMSELYVLGTRCDEFFDISICKISEILYENRMKRLLSKPPSNDMHHPRKLLFSYLPLIHCGDLPISKSNEKKSSKIKSIGVSIVFIIPAILDLILLLGTGHGIFVNIQMTSVEQVRIANYNMNLY